MVTELVEQKVKVLHESIFWEEDDPKKKLTGLGDSDSNKNGSYQIIDLARDAYIWCFTGPRGAGKSLAMTYYAAKAVYLYGCRLVSNYPIVFYLNRINGDITYHESEPLDLYKLLCFDKDYQHCLILMDEAPDIISHMAAMTWKNRLLNIFTRQLRKNMNSLFLGAQQYTLIDKSMRWQTDVIVRCQDAYRKYGPTQGLCRGACILLDLYDNSGQWTGYAKNIAHDGMLGFIEPDDSLELPGKSIWNVFDTNYQQDVFESLRRVDLKLQTYQVGDAGVDDELLGYKKIIADRIEGIEPNQDGKLLIKTPVLYKGIPRRYKGSIMHDLSYAGRSTGGHGASKCDFTDFDMEMFLEGGR